MAKHLKHYGKISSCLLAVLIVLALSPPVALPAEAGDPALKAGSLAAPPGTPGINPEKFIRQFDALLQSQKLPPEAAGLFQGMRGIVEGAAKGQDPQTLREKSGGLLQGLRPLMENPDLPPEAAEMFKSFDSLTKPGAAAPRPEEFLQQFEKLMQADKIPPEIAGMFQGMRGIMEGAAKGQDPQTLREKSGGLLQGLRPLMENPDLPPEAADMLKSFHRMMQKAPTDRPSK